MFGLPPGSVFFKLLGTFLLVVALVLAAETGLAILVGRGAIDRLVQESLGASARDGCESLDRYITERIRETRSWSSLDLMDDVLVGDRLLSIENFLLELRKTRGDHFGGFTVADRNGKIIASTVLPSIGASVSVDAVAPHSVKGSDLRWGESAPGDPPALVVAQPIQSDLSVRPIGWLVADMDWSPIERMLHPHADSNAGGEPDRLLLLVDESGRVLAGGQDRVSRVPWPTSADFLTSRCEVPPEAAPPLRGLAVVAAWRRSSALAIEEAYVTTIFAAAAIGLVLAAGASFVISRGIRRRLKGLIVGATRLAQGELEHRIAEGPEDEFGHVSRAFNTMAGQVERAHDDLEEAAARWRTLVTNAPDIITTIGKDGRILSINHVVAGFDIDRVVGSSAYAYVGPRDRPRLTSAISQVFASGRGASLELEAPGANGTVARYACRIGPVRRDGQVVAAVMIATDVTERRRLEREVLEASDDERARIGQDLHDGLGQALTGVALLSKGLQSRLVARGLPEADDASLIASLVEGAIGQVRDLAKGLFPMALEAGGFHGAMEELAAGVRQVFGTACEFRCDPMADVRDTTTAIHLFRIAQEAVSNALRHGHPQRITITLARHEGGFELTVRDDGKGLPVPFVEGRGTGVRSMRYRASVLGGTFEVRNHRDGGAVMTCRVP